MAVNSYVDSLIRVILYGIMFFSLYMVDFALGSGLALGLAKFLCRSKCTLNKLFFLTPMPSLNALPMEIVSSGGISASVLLSELIIFAAVFMLLNNVQKNHTGRIEQLLKQSRAKLETANSMLDKWNRRKKTAHIAKTLYENIEEITPFRRETPVVHVSVTDGTLPRFLECLSESEDADRPIPACPNPSFHIGFCPTSLDEDDVMSIIMKRDDVGPISDQDDEELDCILNPDYGSRYLYDVIEEDD